MAHIPSTNFNTSLGVKAFFWTLPACPPGVVKISIGNAYWEEQMSRTWGFPNTPKAHPHLLIYESFPAFHSCTLNGLWPPQSQNNHQKAQFSFWSLKELREVTENRGFGWLCHFQTVLHPWASWPWKQHSWGKLSNRNYVNFKYITQCDTQLVRHNEGDRY